MIKILHVSDIHLGDLPGPVKDGVNLRREDTINCMRAVARIAREARPHVSIIAGDLFHRSRTWCDSAHGDVYDAVEVLLHPLCEASENVFLLMGTSNHDNPRAFDVIRQSFSGNNLTICAEGPDVYRLDTTDGDVQILGLPCFSAGRLRANAAEAMDKEEENRNVTAHLNNVVLGLAAKIDKSLPSVLVAHYTVAGAESEGGSTFLAGQDVVLLPHIIDASGVTLACLGHIHKPQRLASCATPTFYSGSINELTFNDEGEEHGFYLHTLGVAGYGSSTFHPTPARLHLTARLNESDIGHFISGLGLPEDSAVLEELSGAIVRVRYSASAEQEKAFNKAEFQKYLYAMGAFHVAEISAIDVAGGVDAYAASTVSAPADSLRCYLAEAGVEGADASRLMELAAPIIQKSDDGREAGRHAGAFTPLRIEVKNYRSYSAAEFSFSEIRMAMVNGPNGAGKSSLFMDAVADCLYEESRGGQIGGWLREGAASGSIAYEFAMGGAEYRVTRTRAKSGKGTLAFASRDESGRWADAGDTAMRLTQAKIEGTLGMDYQTFCSIALIRQDAYGLFLDADSDRRMEVLARLLNLGAFGRMEEGAKEESLSRKRRIAELNDRMSLLSEQIEGVRLLEEADAAQAEAVAKAAGEIAELDKQIAAAQREEALRGEIRRQAEAKGAEWRGLKSEGEEKERAYAKLLEEKAAAERLSSMAEASERAAEAVSEARAELEGLAPDVASLRSLTERRAGLASAVKKAEELIKAIEFSRDAHRATLGKRETIEEAAAGLERMEAERENLNVRAEGYRKAQEEVRRYEADRKTFVAESRERIGALEERLKTAQGKAALMENSACPVDAEKRACSFLGDALEARKTIPVIEKALKEMKDADRQTYELFSAGLDSAKAALEGLGEDPQEALNRVISEIAVLKPAAALKPKLEAAAASIVELCKQEDEHRKTIAESTASMADIDAQIPALYKKAERASELRGTIERNEEIAAMAAKCAAAKATSAAISERVAALESDMAAIAAKVAAAQEAEVLAWAKISASVDGGAGLARLTESRKEAADRQSAAIAERGGIKTRLAQAENARQMHCGYAEEVQVAAREQADYQTLAQAFGLDGIQYMIIRSVVPEVMRRANGILAAMTGGRLAVDFRTERETKGSGKMVNCLDVWVTSLSGGCRPYSSHSGGEKVKIALAVALGLADVKARRAGVQLGMLFIDEPPFLDAEGTEAYADALAEMAARNPTMRILAISHDPAMKARFAQNITVSAGESGSSATMAA